MKRLVQERPWLTSLLLLAIAVLVVLAGWLVVGASAARAKPASGAPAIAAKPPSTEVLRNSRRVEAGEAFMITLSRLKPALWTVNCRRCLYPEPLIL